MTDKSVSSFAVVRFNERTYQPGGVVGVVKGIETAQRTLDKFRWMSERGKPKGGVAIFPRENRSAARNRPGESHHTSTSAARSSRGLSSSVRTISCSYEFLTHASHPATKPPRLRFNARKVGMTLPALTPTPATAIVPKFSCSKATPRIAPTSGSKFTKIPA